MSSNLRNAADTGARGKHIDRALFDELQEGDPDDWDEDKLKRFDQAIEDKMAGGKVRSRKAAIKSILHYGATMKRTASMKVRRDK